MSCEAEGITIHFKISMMCDLEENPRGGVLILQLPLSFLVVRVTCLNGQELSVFNCYIHREWNKKNSKGLSHFMNILGTAGVID